MSCLIQRVTQRWAKIWSSDVSTYAKVTEEVAQLGKIYAQGMAMYSHAMAMAKRIESLKRLKWKTIEDDVHC